LVISNNQHPHLNCPHYILSPFNKRSTNVQQKKTTMKLSTAFNYGLGALVAHGFVVTEASIKLRQNEEPAVPVSQTNTVLTSNPNAAGSGLRRLVDATTCQTVLNEVQYEDPSIDESFISCDTSDGLSYKVTDLSADEVNAHGTAVASGEEELDLPEGSYLDAATGTVKAPKGKKIGLKKNGGGKKGPAGTVQSEAPEGVGGYSWAGRDRNLQDNNGLGITGEKTVLVVRVIAADASTTATEAQLSESVFGNGVDPINLATQYDACSYGKLTFVKTANRSGTGANISNGVTTVTVPSSTTDTDSVMNNDIGTALTNAFGTAPQNLADYVMYCLPSGTMGGIAYASLPGWRSVYSNEWCTYPSAQMHEIGHNLALHHSNEAGSYKDQSGMMGYSYSNDDGPIMCFNAPKSWQLGWFQDKHHVFNQADGSWSGRLIGQVDWANANAQPNDTVILKLNVASDTDHYVMFNRKAGHNSGTVEGGNQVMIQSAPAEGSGAAQSELHAKLNAGGTYTITNYDGSGLDLTLTVNSIDLTANPPFAEVSVFAGCNSDTDCNDLDACNGVETCNTSTGQCIPGTPQAGCCGNGMCEAGSGESFESQVCLSDCADGPFEIKSPLCSSCYIQDGHMFDMEAKGKDLAIQSIKFRNYAAGTAEVWTRSGTHSGFAYSNAGWTQVATAATTVGSWTMQEIILDTPVLVAAGQRQAFYITQEANTNLLYTAGSNINNIAFQDDNMMIYEGPPKVYPFGGQNSPAIFNGEFGYLLKSDVVTPSPVPATPSPTQRPTTGSPTVAPSKFPTKTPTSEPTNNPTLKPTTGSPTVAPSKFPTKTPTSEPTNNPTLKPTTGSPTVAPSKFPTKAPTPEPTNNPTVSPTPPPTSSPISTVAKYVCNRNEPTDVCVEGILLGDSTCGLLAESGVTGCGGSKKCWLADCPATSGPTGPSPTPPPPTPTASPPTPPSNCLEDGIACGKNGDCCSGNCSGKQNKFCAAAGEELP
jgi:hypothetical protein